MLKFLISVFFFYIFLGFDVCEVLRNISYNDKVRNKKEGFFFFIPLLLRKKRIEGRRYVTKNNINNYNYDNNFFCKNSVGRNINPFIYRTNIRSVYNKLYVYKSDKNDNSYHNILNNHINIISERIIQDENNFILPNYCLIEDNKFYKDYDYQTSILIYLENYLKNKNVTSNTCVTTPKKMCEEININFRNDVISYLQNKCSDIIDDIHISQNGILNIRINNNSLIERIKNFYNINILKNNNNNNNNNKRDIILLDFCSVNMSKHIHMGHLKSIFLGYSLSNLFKYSNYHIKNRSHIGDWNLNVALVITFIVMFSNIYMNKENIKNEEHIISNINFINNNNKETPQTYRQKQNKVIQNIYHDNIKDISIDSNANETMNRQNDDYIKQYIEILNNINHEIYDQNYKILDTNKYLNIKLDTLESWYKLSKRLYLQSDIFKRYSKHTLSLMYKKDEKIMNLWNLICKITKEENDTVLKTFKIKKLVEKGEHYYVKYVLKIINMMKKKNILFNLNNKLCVLLKPKDPEKMCNPNNYKNKDNIINSNDIYYDIIQPDDNLYQYIKRNDISYLKKNYTILTLKNDVAYTYAAIDIAAIYYRVTYENANKIIYIVDENQKKHFEQVFSISKYLNLIQPHVECICLNYGYILNEQKKKIKTQSFSNNIFVKDFLIKYKHNVQKNIKDSFIHMIYNKNYIINKKKFNNNIYNKIFLSSIIYSYISVKNSKRQSINNIIQNINREYLYIIDIYNITLYILNFFKKKNYNISDYSFIFINKNIQIEQNLKNVLLDILKFNYIIQECTYNFCIEKLSSYIYKLSHKIYNIYNNNLIFKDIIENANTEMKKEKKKKKKKISYMNNTNYQNDSLLNQIEHKKFHQNQQVINYTMLSNYINNNANIKLSNIQNTDYEQQNICVNNLMDNRILALIIMQSYIYILSESFKILNLHLVKFN
ncbi:arginine--tRNA ligase, putative [Plasmodium sp. gorilla clade G2]|uniref:arginine--tRNA ligase, putative n=1 Tax=Plasmodium sp. gorilla clade G2 TaxID=880535 RepID=UPI000D20F767|nr:arginine--tRNA ligase, putative [Plasmodium sp. gorilla clade G2]SOV14162.1 arginine--tRNA ligase, putative [Plasmodium sp. gorilla clade G2]